MSGLGYPWAYRQERYNADVSSRDKKPSSFQALGGDGPLIWQRWVCPHRCLHFTMQKLLIPKSNGKVRVCWNPDPELKRRLKAMVQLLNLAAEEMDTHRICHGFTEGRSPVTNARCHIGYQFTLTMDLEDFFGHVTRPMLTKLCDTHAGGMILMQNGKPVTDISECFVGGPITGFAGQGLPTSPALANIAFSPADREIMSLCPKGRFAEKPFQYSRYCDDLAFSTNTMATVNLLLQEIPKICDRHGFKINEGKTKIQAAIAGRRIICGCAVGEHDVTIPRELRRRIRAGHHQDKVGLRRRNIRRLLFDRKRWKTKLPLRARFYYQLKGLVEWSKLKLPANERVPQNKIVAAAARVVTAVAGKNISNRIFASFHRKFG